MGQSQGKEARPYDGQGRRGAMGDASTSADAEAGRDTSSRAARSRVSRADLSFLGIGNSSGNRDRDRDTADAPERRETKPEREARRQERERAQRLKERERSLREEHIDGGYLVTLGTYVGAEDFSKAAVRQLQIERKLAPFWRGLNDWSDNWAEHQYVAAARGLPIPAADDPPDPELLPRPAPLPTGSSSNLQNLTVPMGPRTMSAASDRSASNSNLPSPTATGAGRSSPFKPRAKALAAALSVGSRNTSSTELAPKEINLPNDPFVNGQPIEVFLYKDATECPICFLTYPPYLNHTRCCDQAICSECFVQIKRAEPHLPEHHPNGETRDPNAPPAPEDPPEILTSEPTTCPYCQVSDFGVTYEPPPFRRGLAYSTSQTNIHSTAMSSQSSLNSSATPGSPTQPNRRRTHSLSATAPNVVTTDRVRPDWASKLAAARAHQARRAAAATALHAAAFLVGNESRSILRPGRFSRRNTGNNNGGPASSNAEANDAADGNDGNGGNGRRRSRMHELEDLMMAEAMRLSIAAEEERQRKEEKALRKEAKKKLKEERKALKKQGRDPYGGGASGASGSSLSLSGFGRRRGNSGASNLRVEATVQSASNSSQGLEASAASSKEQLDQSDSKGKGVERSTVDTGSEASSSAAALPIPSPSRGGSHLRQMSNASSIGSSLADSPAGSFSGAGYAGPEGSRAQAGRSAEEEGDPDAEPIFNFRSLAEMVGVNIEDGSPLPATEGEHDATHGRPLSRVNEEDDKDGFGAEHIEETSVEGIKATDGGRLRQGSGLPTPEVMITPETPAPIDDAVGETKQLGHSSITEKAPQAMH